MKMIAVALMMFVAFGLFAAENLSGEPRGKDKEAQKEAQLEKYTTYNVVSIGDGPIISVQKTISVPNQKKMGQPDIKKETIEVNYSSGGWTNEMEAAKKFLAGEFKGKKFKVIKRNYEAVKTVVSNEGDIAITKNKISKIQPSMDIVFSNGTRLSDIYADWLEKQYEMKKDAEKTSGQ